MTKRRGGRNRPEGRQPGGKPGNRAGGQPGRELQQAELQLELQILKMQKTNLRWRMLGDLRTTMERLKARRMTLSIRADIAALNHKIKFYNAVERYNAEFQKKLKQIFGEKADAIAEISRLVNKLIYKRKRFEPISAEEAANARKLLDALKAWDGNITKILEQRDKFIGACEKIRAVEKEIGEDSGFAKRLLQEEQAFWDKLKLKPDQMQIKFKIRFLESMLAKLN